MVGRHLGRSRQSGRRTVDISRDECLTKRIARYEGVWARGRKAAGIVQKREKGEASSQEQDLKDHVTAVESLRFEGRAAEYDVVDCCSIEHDANLEKNPMQG